MSKFARAKAANFKDFLSSVTASEDVLNGQEELLITAIDFTMITSGACFGLLRTLATPRSARFS
ncbi:MAG: hypothetical protein WA734_20485 [Candidatus Acidiferrales bacterium]